MLKIVLRHNIVIKLTLIQLNWYLEIKHFKNSSLSIVTRLSAHDMFNYNFTMYSMKNNNECTFIHNTCNCKNAELSIVFI